MQIELYIDGEKKIFTTPFVPMMARRKYFEFEAGREKRAESEEALSAQELIEEEDQVHSILVDIIFNGQFTNEELLWGADRLYIDEKLSEAVFGVKTKKKEEGNEQGK